ncbi:hypothetical protein FNU76_00780 [Chitinimonas arctica]|uniref:RHS protein conserved region domain-containing protein n=1 Tax=Chitinimonas arctica TaxID=2594795 RepID=A0A516SM07_9NEIS|nr:hypothetical protein FNU76_00780 [Chitinimonas arctica]
MDFGAVRYIHTDHLGTARLITDATKRPIWAWQGEPFGNTPPNEDPEGTGGAYAYNPRFPGQYYDKETGLYYNYHRDYDPALGRYAQSDPIGLQGGINTYAYVGSGPLSNVDPLGLAPDINLFKPGFLGFWGEVAYKNAEKFNSAPGEFTVAGHGNPSNMIDSDRKSIPVQDMAKMIQAHSTGGRIFHTIAFDKCSCRRAGVCNVRI